MKPRVMSLVIFTCVVGLIIAPTQVNFLSATLSIIAVAVGSGLCIVAGSLCGVRLLMMLACFLAR